MGVTVTPETYECRLPITPRMEEAIAEMKERISDRFPATTCEMYQGEDPVGIYLIAIVDTDDLEEVMDLIIRAPCGRCVMGGGTPHRRRRRGRRLR
jgi:hypothetical protein